MNFFSKMEEEQKIAYTKFREFLGDEDAIWLENHIKYYVISIAIKENIKLDWNGDCFANLYYVHWNRIYENLKYQPTLEAVKHHENICAKSDIELSDINHRFIQKFTESIEKKYLDDDCRKCRKKAVRSRRTQLRSLDEGVQVEFFCDACGATWID